MASEKKAQAQSSKETKKEQSTCPNCGTPKSKWQGNDGQGYSDGDQTYCCEGCATETGCDCGENNGESELNA